MSPPRRPPGRYDEPRPLPSGLVRAVAVLLLVGLTALTYAVWQRAADRTTVSLKGYRVVDAHAVEVRFEVHRKDDGRVVCAVRAIDRNGAEVGAEDVTVAAGVTTVRHRLTTTGTAAAAQVTGCSSP
jgi:hypothetical protein